MNYRCSAGVPKVTTLLIIDVGNPKGKGVADTSVEHCSSLVDRPLPTILPLLVIPKQPDPSQVGIVLEVSHCTKVGLGLVLGLGLGWG